MKTHIEATCSKCSNIETINLEEVLRLEEVLEKDPKYSFIWYCNKCKDITDFNMKETI